MLIQVCTDLSDPATREREIRTLVAASAEQPEAAPLLITLDSIPPDPAPSPPLKWQPAAESLLDGVET